MPGRRPVPVRLATTMRRSYGFNHPVTAVMLRLMAQHGHHGEHQVESFSATEMAEVFVNQARSDLGLAPITAGAPYDFLQREVYPTDFLAKLGRRYVLPEQYHLSWWIHALPSHRRVRELSHTVRITQHELVECSLSTRAGVLQSGREGQTYDEMVVYLATMGSTRYRVQVGACKTTSMEARGGIYFFSRMTLNLNAPALYVGHTREWHTRSRQYYETQPSRVHNPTSPPMWSVFISPEDEAQYPAIDVLLASETLLIALKDEICFGGNHQLSLDARPHSRFYVEALQLTEASAAILIWLAREHSRLNLSTQVNLPYKPVPGLRSWPKCYLGSK